MNDRELLESIRTQISNHLVMPDAAKGEQSAQALGGSIVRHGKGRFGPGVTTFDLVGVKAGDIIHLEVADAHEAVKVTIYGPNGLQWEADPAPLVAGAGQVLPAPTAPMDGLYVVEVSCATPGTLWWP